MQYNISFDIAAVVVGIGILIYYISKRSIMTMQRRVFGALLWLSFVSAVLDIITAIVNYSGYSSVPMYIINTLYLIMFNSIPFLYYWHFLLNIKGIRQWNLIEKVFMFIPYVPIMLLLITTPWTKLIYSYTPAQGYVHGPLFLVLYFQAFLYMLVTLVIIIIYRKRFSFSQKTAFFLYITGTLIALIVQIIMPEQLVMQFVLAYALVLSYLATTNLADDEDSRYGIRNKEAFIKKMTYLMEHGADSNIIGINLKGQQEIREALGVFRDKLFFRKIIEIIQNIIKGTELYIISDKQFAIIIEDKFSETEKIEYYLWKVFCEPVEFDTNDIMVNISLFQVDCPKDASTVEEVVDILEMAAKENFENDEGNTVHTGKELLDKKRRENHIVQAIQKAIHNKSFKVYYQPIFDVKESYYHSAEALIRLIDEDLGFISPEEFIPLAEKKGLILAIGDFVFEQVCRDISDKDFENYKIKFIEINLSVVQCMQKNLKKRLGDIMKKYCIRPEQIDLEITETAMVTSGDIIHENMSELSQIGCTFAMDDFGTGFSNLSSMIEYPFNIVKLDKSMVWSAMEDEKAMSILKHTIAMLKDLSISIVAEGIETMEQAGCLARLGCDYFQGYYYSRPIPVDDFIEVVKKLNL